MYEMSTHILDAIRLNNKRAKMYASLSNGTSRVFSYKLILAEIACLPVALVLDLQAKRFEKAGLAIFSDIFESMDNVPNLNPEYPDTVNHTASLKEVKFENQVKELKYATTTKNFTKLESISDEIIAQLKEQPHVYLMTRHLFESIRRIASVAPYHLAKANDMSLPSPLPLLLRLLKLHYWALTFGQKLDRQSASIQTSGVPFLFYDLPTIHAYDPVKGNIAE